MWDDNPPPYTYRGSSRGVKECETITPPPPHTHTYRGSSRGAKECEKITPLHELHNNEVGIIIKTDAKQPQDVLMLEVLHQYGLFQEFLLLLFWGTLSQSLQKWKLQLKFQKETFSQISQHAIKEQDIGS